MALKLADGKQLPVKAFIEKYELGSWKKFRTELPLAEQKAFIQEARYCELSGSREEVREASVVLIYRKNDLLNLVSKCAKSRLGNGVCAVTVPEGTDELSAPEFSKLKGIVSAMAEGRKIILRDETIMNLVQKFDGTSEMLDKLGQFASIYGAFSLIEREEARVLVIRENLGTCAKTLAKMGISNVTISLGAIDGLYGNEDPGSRPLGLETHGATIIDRKGIVQELYCNPNTVEDLADVFHFFAEPFEQNGIKAYPLFILGKPDEWSDEANIAILQDINPSIGVEKNGRIMAITGISKEEGVSLVMEKTAVLSDSHGSLMLDERFKKYLYYLGNSAFFLKETKDGKGVEIFSSELVDKIVDYLEKMITS